MIASDGAGRRAFARVLRELHNIDTDFISVSMSGKTDPQILAEILTIADKQHLDANEILRTSIDPYIEILAEEIKSSARYIVHEGILPLLDKLQAHTDAYLGLLTGNIEAGARTKLAQFDLNKYFPIGAYGSDSANRLELPAIATRRAQDYYKQKFAAHEVVVVGDSVNDILCAKHFQAKALVVNTGKTTWEALEKLAPDYLFKTLRDTDKVMAAIFS